jgi:hypothetical protein
MLLHPASESGTQRRFILINHGAEKQAWQVVI